MKMAWLWWIGVALVDWRGPQIESPIWETLFLYNGIELLLFVHWKKHFVIFAKLPVRLA
jgi:hypothetical protein